MELRDTTLEPLEETAQYVTSGENDKEIIARLKAIVQTEEPISYEFLIRRCLNSLGVYKYGVKVESRMQALIALCGFKCDEVLGQTFYYKTDKKITFEKYRVEGTGYSFDYEYPKHKHLAVEHPVRMECLPAGTREDACVAPMVEYAGDLKGWFLEDSLVTKIEETMGTKKAAYLQGNVVVLGSDNACFEKMLLLRHETTGVLYRITPEWYYRPDVYVNLQDQQNVALSGFACFVNMSDMPLGRYEVGMVVKDKISKQHLLRVTTRSIELE